ncbi:hypothetical protein [Streptomyces sp. WM6386]|uniref:hypothetical protein n=1 Tax=Streptomyces sp. WM6386 TaxID=1415558 RepID=UPI00061969DC|nr:hypothetical protein [Streptomyces sp. WM6386]KKD03887.1 hypothetical protein TN53_32905 [Streptomyces sp. WM6386]
MGSISAQERREVSFARRSPDRSASRKAFESADDGAEGGDPIGEVVRADGMRIRETVHVPLGIYADLTAGLLACGLPGNTLAAMGLPANAVRQ